MCIRDRILRAARINSEGEIISVDIVSEDVGFIVDIVTNPFDGFMYYTDVTGNIGRIELA